MTSFTTYVSVRTIASRFGATVFRSLVAAPSFVTTGVASWANGRTSSRRASAVVAANGPAALRAAGNACAAGVSCSSVGGSPLARALTLGNRRLAIPSVRGSFAMAALSWSSSEEIDSSVALPATTSCVKRPSLEAARAMVAIFETRRLIESRRASRASVSRRSWPVVGARAARVLRMFGPSVRVPAPTPVIRLVRKERVSLSRASSNSSRSTGDAVCSIGIRPPSPTEPVRRVPGSRTSSRSLRGEIGRRTAEASL